MRPRTGGMALATALACVSLALPCAAQASEPGWQSEQVVGQGTDWRWTKLVAPSPSEVYALHLSRPVTSDYASVQVTGIAADGSAGSTQTLSQPDASSFDGAGDGRGDALAVWDVSNSPAFGYAAKKSGAGFGSAGVVAGVPASQQNAQLYQPVVAMNRNGDAVVVYSIFG